MKSAIRVLPSKETSYFMLEPLLRALNSNTQSGFRLWTDAETKNKTNKVIHGDKRHQAKARRQKRLK
jgi:hypothetical protein